MRLDKFLKVARIIKRRKIAKDEINFDSVLLNNKIVKPSKEVKVGDIISFNNSSYRIEKICDFATEETAKKMYTKLC